MLLDSGRSPRIGGCHRQQTGTPVLASDQEIIAAYSAFCEYVPGKPSTDQGCDPTAVKDGLKSTGMMLGGKNYKIDDYVLVSTVQALIEAAIVDFGGVSLCINLPTSWLDNTAASGFTWDVPPKGDTNAGGHEVFAFDFSDTGVVLATWGMTGTMTWKAIMSGKISGTPIVSMILASLAPAWYGNGGVDPAGLNTATLQQALTDIGNGTVPPIVPVNPPTPVPTPPTPVPVPVPVPTPTPPSPIPTPTPATITLEPGLYTIAAGCRAVVNQKKSTVTVTD